MMIKSMSFYSYELNKEKYSKIKDYAILCLKQKNILSFYINQHLILDFYYDKIFKFDFITKSKHLKITTDSKVIAII